jgi:hypothetical protein
LAVRIDPDLTQKILRPYTVEKLSMKEKHGATFVTLENNRVPNRILTDAKTTRSHAFSRFTVAAIANILLTPANIEQWYHCPKPSWQRCEKDAQLKLAHILNGCPGNFTEMTHRDNKIVDIIRRAIEDFLLNRLRTEIGENTIMKAHGLSEEVRSLRPDPNFVGSTFDGAIYGVD